VPDATLVDPRQLAYELTAARAAFMARLESVLAEQGNAARLTDAWGPRELVAHLGYWTGHAADAIHAVEQGRAAEFDLREREADPRNETVGRVARATDLATVRRREEGSYLALLERLGALDPALLDVRLAGWGSLREGIRGNGPMHYRDHTADLGTDA
jgi:hypothetical protein